MLKSASRLFLAVAVLAGTVSCALCAEPGTVVVDGFKEATVKGEWKPEGRWDRWQVKDGVLSGVGNNYGGMITLSADPGQEYVLEISVKLVEPQPDQPVGFAGVDVFGYSLFMVPNSGYLCLYKKSGDTRLSSKSVRTDMPLGAWHQYKVVKHADGKLEWFADGKKILDLTDAVESGPIRLRITRLKAEFKDVKIYKTAAGK